MFYVININVQICRFQKKIIHFEAVNLKNIFQEGLDSLNGGNWIVHGEEITFSVTDCVSHEETENINSPE